MTAEQFQHDLAAWFKDAHEEAIRLFDSGCLPTDCLKIATQFADSRANMRAQQRQALSGVAIGMPMPRRNQ
jgi:hypothetical protein